MDNELIYAKLLFALARKRKWGESHTAYEHMFRQFKSEMLGKEGMKLATKAAEELVKKGFNIHARNEQRRINGWTFLFS